MKARIAVAATAVAVGGCALFAQHHGAAPTSTPVAPAPQSHIEMTPGPQRTSLAPRAPELARILAMEAANFNAADAAFLRDLHYAWHQDRDDESLFGVPDGERFVSTAQHMCTVLSPRDTKWQVYDVIDPAHGRHYNAYFVSPELIEQADAFMQLDASHYCPARAAEFGGA